MRNPRLLLVDDRQISMLIVNYHIQNINRTPRIDIKIAPMRDFIEDLRLIEKFRSKISFSKDEDLTSYDEKEIIYGGIKDPIKYFESVRELLTEFNELKGLTADNHFEQMYKLKLRDYQSAFFLMERTTPTDLMQLYPNKEIVADADDILGQIFEEHRNMIITYSLPPLKTEGLPTLPGETQQFKDTIREMMQKLRDKYAALFPLLINLNLTILYVPQRTQEVDLGNLARYIVPFINEALKPPNGFWFTGYQHLNRFPQHTIIQYQIIKIPRSNKDPENGAVRLVFGEYSPYKDCWSEIEDVIDR